MISSLIPNIISENGTASLKLIIFEGKTVGVTWLKILPGGGCAVPWGTILQLFLHYRWPSLPTQVGWICQRGAWKVWSRCHCCAALHRKGSSSVLFPSTKTWNEVPAKLLEVQVLGSIMLLWELRVLQASLRALLVWTKPLEVTSAPCSVLCFSTHHLEKLLFGWFPKGCRFLKSSCEFTLWSLYFWVHIWAFGEA